MVPSRSGGSRKSPEHPFTKDADAMEVRRRPAHNLQSEIADGVLAQLLGERLRPDTLPGLEKPTVFDLADELTDRLVLIPVEIHAGNESAIWSEDLILKVWPR
jgi:hypothetical protein